MKSLFFSFIITFFPSKISFAQFVKAELNVFGTTSSLNTRSIEKALEKLAFIDVIEADLEEVSFTLTFRENAKVSPEKIAKAVRKAGFSVGYLKISNDFKSSSSKCYENQNIAFTFLNDEKEFKAGIYEVVFVHKDLLSKKIFKEYKKALPEKCRTLINHYYVALADQWMVN